MKSMSALSFTALGMAAVLTSYSQDTAQHPPVHPQKLYTPLPLMPQYKGGNDSLKAFIKRNVKYPTKARKHHISGTVQVDFRVTKEGKITGAHIYKSLGYGCDEEALRVVSLMPAWIPSMSGREPIEMDYHVEIPFGKPKE